MAPLCPGVGVGEAGEMCVLLGAGMFASDPLPPLHVFCFSSIFLFAIFQVERGQTSPGNSSSLCTESCPRAGFAPTPSSLPTAPRWALQKTFPLTFRTEQRYKNKQPSSPQAAVQSNVYLHAAAAPGTAWRAGPTSRAEAPLYVLREALPAANYLDRRRSAAARHSLPGDHDELDQNGSSRREQATALQAEV